jgi:hypothetical protein
LRIAIQGEKMLKNCFSLMLALVFFCTTSGVAVLGKGKTDVKLSETEKIKQKVLKRGTGTKARARVKLADGTKMKGYISESAADDFTLVRTDEQAGVPVRVNYRDVDEFKAQGKGMSTTSKVLIGTGIAVGVLVVVGALLVRDFRRSFGR